MRNLLLAASMAALIGSPAAAAVNLNQPSKGYTYFHRAGATMEAHDAQIRECMKSGYFSQPSAADGATAASQGLAGVIAAVIVNVAVAAMQADNIQLTTIENCMVLHGWNVVQIPEAQGEPMTKLEQPALHAALEPLVGAHTPAGEIVRTYDNDLAKPDTVAFLGIGPIDKKSFSRLALPELTAEPEAEGAIQKASVTKPPKMPKTAKKLPTVQLLEKLQPVPEGSALLLVRFEGQRGFPTLNFRRLGPDEETPAWVDGKPAIANLLMPVTAWAGKPKAPDGVVAMAVPPGRWVLDSVSAGPIPNTALGVHLCYGAPAFEAAAGEVVYLGSFAMNRLTPDMAIDPARTALSAKPELTEKLKPAGYVNGLKGSCGGLGYGYALEVADAPYEEGYGLGSRARLAAATPAVAVEAAPADAAPETAPAEAAPADAAPLEEPKVEPVAEPAAEPAEAAPAATAT